MSFLNVGVDEGSSWLKCACTAEQIKIKADSTAGNQTEIDFTINEEKVELGSVDYDC